MTDQPSAAAYEPVRNPSPLTWPVPPLVGIKEAAVILGVSKQRVHQLLRSGIFPAPVARLAATPVWRESDICWYSIHRDKIASSVARITRLGFTVGPGEANG